MPESYLIDKAKLLSDIWDNLAFLEGAPVRALYAAEYLDDLVRKQPTIEPEVRHGRWIEIQTDLICSVCKWEYSDELPFMSNHGLDSMTEAFAFCPHCGARMDATDTNYGGEGVDDNV